ncbi:MAG: hypothetical protein ACFFDI_21270 [Promethearchaeota archaeon]
MRKEEHRTLKKMVDETLTRSKYIRLYSKENLQERHKQRFHRIEWVASEDSEDLSDQGELSCSLGIQMYRLGASPF